ncbi:hypothetical protein C8R48DRAFT_769597 [Suillus tomentosus]|nr:hypothetical protein C8R48DRAFT_769597 [Suillus tomentosus]
MTYREAYLIKAICLVLESAKHHYNPSLHDVRDLDVCRKIHSRMRSSHAEQNLAWELLAVLPNAPRFTLTAAKESRDPADLWSSQHLGIGDSHSPEDFDWLIVYLDECIYFDNFFKSLITCMTCMPVHLRHAALLLAHRAREEMVSIDAIDNAELRDMILTEFSPAIMTAVCPQRGVTLSNDDPDRFLHYHRDFCYLDLLFALARNSN